MIDETHDSKDTGAPADGNPRHAALAAGGVVGEIQETVDPFDYAETIVRDLALHVGSRLRDFRADLSAMHTAVIQLPETMRINALGQSIQELRERVAHLTGVVSHQATRPAEEIDRLGRSVADLAQRLAGLEAFIATAKRAGVPGDQLPTIPLPEGGLVGLEQFDRVIDQLHELIVRVVGAVRELQLDLRDLRERPGVIKALPAPAQAPAQALVAAPAPVPVAFPSKPSASERGSDIDRIEARLARLEARPASTAAAASVPGDDAGDLAALVFGTWHRLGHPAGPDSLRLAVDEVLAVLSGKLTRTVKPPQLPRGPGPIAVCTGGTPQAPAVALVAIEDLSGQSWTLAASGAELSTVDSSGGTVLRQATWRALLSAAALVEQTRPGTRVLPLLVYGNGFLDRTPPREAMQAYGQAVGCVGAATRLVQIAAQDIALPGLSRPGDVIGSLRDLLS